VDEESDSGRGATSAPPRFRDRLEGALLRWRYPLGAVLLILIIVDALSISWTVLTGRGSPVPVPVAVTFSDESQLLLALGTLALAYAAALQALAAREQTRVARTQARASEALSKAATAQADSAERARQDQLHPHLSITLLEPTQPGAPTGPDRPVMTSPFLTRVVGIRNIRLVVRNMGPGNAMHVRVECPHELVKGTGPWTGRESLTIPEVSDLSPRFVPVGDRSLQANEPYEFEIPIALPDPPVGGASSGNYRILGRIEVLAACKDVEGRDQPTERFGIKLQQVIPSQDEWVQKQAGSGQELVKTYELLWSEVREEGAGVPGWIPLPIRG
jgi:hypothetical protein